MGACWCCCMHVVSLRAQHVWVFDSPMTPGGELLDGHDVGTTTLPPGPSAAAVRAIATLSA